MASDERVGRVADRDEHGHGHAALAGRAVAGADGGVGRHLDVGVREDDHVVLGAAQGLDALAGLRPRLVDVAGDRSRADEAHGCDVGVLEDPVDRDLVTVDHVEDAVRNPGLLQDLGGQDRGRGILLRRLENERVPARDRRRPHPHGDHGGEVERRDPCDDAQRLPDRVDVDARRGLLAEVALEERRDPAHELDDLDPALHLAHRVGEDLPVLGRQEPGELLAMLVDELVDPEHEVRALRERPLPPLRERGLGGCDRAVDLLDRSEVHLSRLLAGRGVVDRPSPAARPPHALPADPVRDQLQLGRHRCAHPRAPLRPCRSS